MECVLDRPKGEGQGYVATVPILGTVENAGRRKAPLPDRPDCLKAIEEKLAKKAYCIANRQTKEECLRMRKWDVSPFILKEAM